MKLQQILIRGVFIFFLGTYLVTPVIAQCGKFADLTTKEKEDARKAHVLYRDAIKMKNMDEAFSQWEIAYKLAPAADGQRPFHYTDGRDFYTAKYDAETDAAKKEEYAQVILRLYDEEIVCYGEDGNDADLLGRKVYDMFYKFNRPYDETIAAIKETLKRHGNDVSYTILAPYAHIAQYNFTEDVFTKEQAREVHKVVNEIGEYNIANNEEFGETFKEALDAANGSFATVEHLIFDCEYFKAKLEPQYKADPDNRALYTEIYQTLVNQGCDKEDPLLKEISAKDMAFQEQEHAKNVADWEANNPVSMANKMRKSGDIDGAIAKLQEAIDGSSDSNEQANYYLLMSDIQYRDKGRYSAAKDAARKAAKLKSGWGKPYIYLGDIIIKQSKSCDSWNQRLAVIAAIDKYSKAKSVDSSVAADANRRIGRISSSLPEVADGHMRGIKPGQTVSVKCVGEQVKVRFKD